MSAVTHTPPFAAAPRRTLFGTIVTFVRAANWRRAATRDLERLQEHELRDLGINRHDIAAAVESGVRRLWVDEFRSRGN